METLHDLVQRHERVVFFGGAGMSTESGIPDFRSAAGLYASGIGAPHPPEYLLSHECWVDSPADFYAFYRTSMLYPDAQPNAGHRALARLEEQGRLTAVITQNIDGLHQAAGSQVVLELHGSVHRNTCVRCRRVYGLEAILASTGIPTCICGGTIKPDVVLYSEPLDARTVDAAVQHVRDADLLVVGGTSLAVYPAAGLLDYFRGDSLVLINKTATPVDDAATLVIRDNLAAVLDAAID
ncbi:MAG TPA: NAD-dependent protein deacylase [Propionibacteriaceae bacterium]|nr:NAD-dependent protein deacylase [Propionibacteriaceae bacterium]